jgi:hypothetical protein
MKHVRGDEKDTQNISLKIRKKKKKNVNREAQVYRWKENITIGLKQTECDRAGLSETKYTHRRVLADTVADSLFP